MLKFRDVLSRWERRELSMMEAGELLGMSERQFRRYRERFEEEGEAGLIDRRLGQPSPRRIAATETDRMIELYRTVYRGWNVKHFHEHGVRDHRFSWGYTWTKTQLHAAGLVERAKRRGAHRRRRERKPCEGMMLHQDGSQHAWLEGQAPLDLIVTMDGVWSFWSGAPMTTRREKLPIFVFRKRLVEPEQGSGLQDDRELGKPACRNEQ
jgi:transposase